MKKYFFVFLMMAVSLFADRDPWEPYGNNGNGNGHGYGHNNPKNPHYPVPEPATYGVVFIALAISFVLIKRPKR